MFMACLSNVSGQPAQRRGRGTISWARHGLGHGQLDAGWPTPPRTRKCSFRTKETMSSQVRGHCACVPSARLWLHDGCMAARRACERRAWGVCAGVLRARQCAEARAVSSPGARAPALVHVGYVTLILCGFTGGAAAQEAPAEEGAVDAAAPPSATPSAAQDASEQGAAVDAASPPSVMPSTEEAEDVLAAVAASGGSDRRSGSVEREDHGEVGGEQDSSGGPPEVDTMETDEQDAGEEPTEAEAEEQREASEAPAAADETADGTAAEVAPTADEEAEVAPKEHTDAQGGAAMAQSQENDNADDPAEELHTVKQEPMATPAADSAASDSGGASKGSGGGGGKGIPLAVCMTIQR